MSLPSYVILGLFVGVIHVDIDTGDKHVEPLGTLKFHAHWCTVVCTRPIKSRKLTLFGKQSQRKGEPFHRFLQFLGAFMRPNTLHSYFKFYVINFTSNGVIAEKPRVSHLPLNLHCTLQEQAQLMLTNPRDAFRGRSKSPNILPFHMLGIFSFVFFVFFV